MERTIELLEHEDSPREHNNTNSNEQGPGHACRIAVPKGAAARGSMSHLLGAMPQQARQHASACFVVGAGARKLRPRRQRKMRDTRPWLLPRHHNDEISFLFLFAFPFLLLFHFACSFLRCLFAFPSNAHKRYKGRCTNP